MFRDFGLLLKSTNNTLKVIKQTQNLSKYRITAYSDKKKEILLGLEYVSALQYV